ncbi:hypothetical protein [Streptomyces sp. NBC_01296]|nr:hypothetical protein OG299_01935 [Streptomyces sp. NBC_01296]
MFAMRYGTSGTEAKLRFPVYDVTNREEFAAARILAQGPLAA